LKLILDIAKSLFSRIVILLFVALVLVAMDVSEQNEKNVKLTGELLKEKEAWLLASKANLETQAKQQSAEQARYLKEYTDYKTKQGELNLELSEIDIEIFTIESRLYWFNKALAFKKKKQLKKLKKERKSVVKKLKNLKAPKSVSGELLLIEDPLPEQYQEEYLHQLQNQNVWSQDFIKNSIINNHGQLLFILFIGLFFGPVTLRAFNFFLFAPLAKKAKSIRINPAASVQDDLVQYGEAQKEILIDVDSSSSLFVKPGWFNLNTEGLTRTCFLWDWRNPFVSYALGLVGMTEFVPDNQQTRQVKLASEDDPNQEVVSIKLHEHPGYVIKHGHVVAITGEKLKLKKQWRLLDWKSWLFGNVRYVYFQGTGTLYIHGYGKISTSIANSNSRIKERHIIGFDTRVPFKLARTETFINYWLYSKPLYDVHFPEQGQFLQQQAFGKKDEKIFRSLLEDILGMIGKVIGF